MANTDASPWPSLHISAAFNFIYYLHTRNANQLPLAATPLAVGEKRKRIYLQETFMVDERVQWSSVGNDLHRGTGAPGAELAGAYAK